MLNRSPGTVRHERQVRPVRRLHRRFRQVQMLAQASAITTARLLPLDVLRIEDGVIAEIVTFSPDCFLPFGLPLIMDEASDVDTCH